MLSKCAESQRIQVHMLTFCMYNHNHMHKRADCNYLIIWLAYLKKTLGLVYLLLKWSVLLSVKMMSCSVILYSGLRTYMLVERCAAPTFTKTPLSTFTPLLPPHVQCSLSDRQVESKGGKISKCFSTTCCSALRIKFKWCCGSYNKHTWCKILRSSLYKEAMTSFPGCFTLWLLSLWCA